MVTDPVPFAPAHWPCETGLLSDLLLRCGRADEAALARLFDVMAPLVTAGLSSRVDPDRLPERVKDVFVELWRSAPDYRPGETTAVEWVMRRVAAVDAAEVSRRTGVGRDRLAAAG